MVERAPAGKRVDYTLTDFGDASSVVGDDPTGADNQVAATTKPEGCSIWANARRSYRELLRYAA